ncbi:MAG: ADP-ribosylglycohydrolase family protein, partial [Candidatus Nealsonbacteria bacterium]|nr:ADP-ribosylglycohydrolase family protein [Candidatus Nealsonbacteria bacterium]
FLDYLQIIALTVEKELFATGDKISEQIDRIFFFWRDYVVTGKIDREIASRFGNGTSYAYNSFGLSYAFFISCPNSFSVVWQAATAGGDTDSNASIAGSLCGALNGSSFIPSNLLLNLERREYIETLVERFFQICSPASIK